jgi:hypothetical protein
MMTVSLLHSHDSCLCHRRPHLDKALSASGPSSPILTTTIIMSNLAAPALRVSAAVADKASSCEPAVADRVQQSSPLQVQPMESAGPCIPYDDPVNFSPMTVHLITNSGRVTTTKQSGITTLLSVSSLRGESGATFETYAAILRGAPEKNFLKVCLPCIYDERDFVTFGEVKKYCLIKGSTCFIFLQDTDLAPLYAIPLDEVYAVQEDPNHPDPASITVSPVPGTNKPRKCVITVMLKYRRDHSQAYQFTFDTEQDPSLAKRFMDAVEMGNAASKKQGGVATQSILRAKVVAKQAAQQQPNM